MASTLTNLLYHIIFSTKDRSDLITPEFEPELYSYIGGIIRSEKGRLLNVGGTANHLHVLCTISPVITVSQMLQRIKGHSSKWINSEKRLPQRFSWQRGYAAFTVSESNCSRVARYIENQKEHHRKLSFKEELIQFLKKHIVAYDEIYLWD